MQGGDIPLLAKLRGKWVRPSKDTRKTFSKDVLRGIAFKNEFLKCSLIAGADLVNRLCLRSILGQRNQHALHLDFVPAAFALEDHDVILALHRVTHHVLPGRQNNCSDAHLSLESDVADFVNSQFVIFGNGDGTNCEQSDK